MSDTADYLNEKIIASQRITIQCQEQLIAGMEREIKLLEGIIDNQKKIIAILECRCAAQVS